MAPPPSAVTSKFMWMPISPSVPGGPAVRNDQRHRVLVRRLDGDEVDVTPSISVVNCGSAFSSASQLRQS
jgi:hypothetical protein